MQQRALSSPLWQVALLAVVLVVVACSRNTDSGAQQAVGLVQDGQHFRLHSFRLIPGDSPEARRRRRERRRRLKLMRESKESSSSSNEVKETEEITSTKSEEEEENPFELQRDVLYEGYGVHYVDLWVGCGKPQRVTVIVDTGSSFTGFPCKGCHKCGGGDDGSDEQYHTDGLFQQDLSTCFVPVDAPDNCLLGRWDARENTCRASASYSEGSSWTAFEAVDQVYTGGDHDRVDVEREDEESFPLHFGCQDRVTGYVRRSVLACLSLWRFTLICLFELCFPLYTYCSLFETQLADGIAGMKNDDTSLWKQMYNQKKIEQQAFSLCFARPNHVDRAGTIAGAMVMGGTDTRLHTTPMAYAQQMARGGKYVVRLEKVYLQSAVSDDAKNKQSAASQLHNIQIFEEDLNGGGQVIVDSGTTSTYLTYQLEAHFVQVFNSIVPEDVLQLGKSRSFKLTQKHFEKLPTIVFQMKGYQEEDDEVEAPEITTVPGIVGKDLDGRHAGKSIMVRMPPSHYLSRDNEDDDDDEAAKKMDGWYNLNINFDTKRGRNSVLGANFMRGHDVLFDMDNQRIGFAESNCDYSVIAEDEEAG
jgi:hypothetical protein